MIARARIRWCLRLISVRVYYSRVVHGAHYTVAGEARRSWRFINAVDDRCSRPSFSPLVSARAISARCGHARIVLLADALIVVVRSRETRGRNCRLSLARARARARRGIRLRRAITSDGTRRGFFFRDDAEASGDRWRISAERSGIQSPVQSHPRPRPQPEITRQTHVHLARGSPSECILP